jgi:predicted small lipoprotein YifL
MRVPLLLVAAALSIMGCGYKGPLYLPKPKPEVQKPASTPAPKPEGSKTDDAAAKE